MRLKCKDKEMEKYLNRKYADKNVSDIKLIMSAIDFKVDKFFQNFIQTKTFMVIAGIIFIIILLLAGTSDFNMGY